MPTRGPLDLGTAQVPGDSAGEFCLYLLSGGTENGAGEYNAGPGRTKCHGNRMWGAGGVPTEGLLM